VGPASGVFQIAAAASNVRLERRVRAAGFNAAIGYD
jgi:hypothetical protein